MNYGAVFPQIEYGSDPLAIRDYAQAAEGLGYSHVIAYDHVLGANPDRPGGWSGPYTYKNSFQEPFMLFSYMSAFTQRLGFLTGILILPQRQTALVAKQAANLDIYCGGRFRLGVGLGWNEVEYIGLNEDFHNRGRRMEEQVELLRQLWTEPLVNFKGRWHNIPDGGINPLPIQKPIPIWFGGQAEQALQRTARLADGWLPNTPTADNARPQLDIIYKTMDEIGRPHDSLKVEGRFSYGDGNPDTWKNSVVEWTSLGASYIGFNTMRSGFQTPKDHLGALEKFAKEVF